MSLFLSQIWYFLRFASRELCTKPALPIPSILGSAKLFLCEVWENRFFEDMPNLEEKNSKCWVLYVKCWRVSTKLAFAKGIKELSQETKNIALFNYINLFWYFQVFYNGFGNIL